MALFCQCREFVVNCLIIPPLALSHVQGLIGSIFDDIQDGVRESNIDTFDQIGEYYIHVYAYRASRMSENSNVGRVVTAREFIICKTYPHDWRRIGEFTML